MLRSADLCLFGNRELIYFPAPKPPAARPCSQPCCSWCPAQHSSCHGPAQSASILLVFNLRPGCCEELLAVLAPELCCEEKVRSSGPSTSSGLWWKDVTLQVGENWLLGYPKPPQVTSLFAKLLETSFLCISAISQGPARLGLQEAEIFLPITFPSPMALETTPDPPVVPRPLLRAK